jgi:hypothetical protein
MRAPNKQTAPLTRLLLEKSVDYAELEENVRIALSVLHEDGWTVSRVGLTLPVTVEFQAVPLVTLDLSKRLEAATEKFREVRTEVCRLRKERWLMAGYGIAIGYGLNISDLGYWCVAAIGVCMLAWAGNWLKDRKKKGTA